MSKHKASFFNAGVSQGPFKNDIAYIGDYY